MRIRDPHPDPDLIRKEMPMQLSEKQASALVERLKGLTDSRCKKGVRHRNIATIALSLCAVIFGCRSYTAIAQWAKQCSQRMLRRLWYRKKGNLYIPPSEPTIRRQLQRIDAEEVDRVIADWLGQLSLGNAIGIDGKTLRGARRDDGTKVHLLSAFIRNLAISLLRLAKYTNIAAAVRHMAAKPHLALQLIGA